MKCFLSVCLLAVAGMAAAQAPGYLGKRFFVQADLATLPAIGGPTAANHGLKFYGEKGGGIGLNAAAGLQLGYAVSRRHVVALGARYIRTGMKMEASTESLFNVSGGFDYRTDFHDLFFNLKGPEISVAWQTYNPLKGSLAPMGFFTALSFHTTFARGEILDKKTTYGYDIPGLTGHAPLGIEPRYTHLALGLEFGQHVILKDKFLLKISALTQLPLGLDAALQPESVDYDDLSYNQATFKKRAIGRLSGYSFFNVKIGVGYLF